MNAAVALVQRAKEYCVEHRCRFTPPREHVLVAIAESTAPVGAYDIIERLQPVIQHVKPPTVYRAISFWQSHGFIHRIEGLNAYTLCREGHLHTGSQFMICDTCGNAQEIHMCHVPEHIEQRFYQHGFQPQRWNLEVYGQCHACVKKS